MNRPKEITLLLGKALTLTVPVPAPPPGGTTALTHSGLMTTTFDKVRLTGEPMMTRNSLFVETLFVGNPIPKIETGIGALFVRRPGTTFVTMYARRPTRT